MNKYKKIIYWSKDDNCFVAEIPELPGCMADGETEFEALASLNEAAQHWIEVSIRKGREIPEPKGRLEFA